MFIALSLLLALGIGFLIFTLVEMRKAAEELRTFLDTTSKSLDVTLREADLTLRSVRAVTDTVNEIAYDTRRLSHRISDTAKGVGTVAQYLGSASAKTKISTIALGAGIKAAFDVLSKRIAQKKEVGHE